MSHDEMSKAIESSDKGVTHAGIGSIVNAIKQRKYVICIPWLKSKREHNEDHQKEIAQKFAELGYIKSANTLGELEEIFTRKESLNYPSTTADGLVGDILEEIKSLAGNKQE